MERLLLLQLESAGCAAEVLLNGMPVAALGPAGGRACVAVHEYTLTGKNGLALTIGPSPAGLALAPQPRVAIGPTWARVRLVLTRQGHSVGDPKSRELAVIEWATAEGKGYDSPATVSKEVDLPVNFPRWRWLDAPAVSLTPGVRRQVLEFLQQIAVELNLGNPEPLLVASKLKYDELALAYQRSATDAAQRFRDHVQQLYAARRLRVAPPTAEDLLLRPLLDGRLIECLDALGAPALQSRPEDASGQQAWPVRLAMVEGKIYVLR